MTVSDPRYLGLAQAALDEIGRTFRSLGWDLPRSLRSLNTHLRRAGSVDFDFQRHSVHGLLMAAQARHVQPRRVLELGTYLGETTRLLSQLLPAAEIVTVDLPDDAPDYGEYAGPDDASRAEFARRRDENVAGTNIRFIRSDSFLLSVTDIGQFDLVWVDASHLYPNVAWDTHFAYHACRPGGWVMSDDIEFVERSETRHASIAGGEVIRYLQERLDIDVLFFPKRLSPRYLLDERRHCKFVTAFRKPSNTPLK